MHVPPMFSKNFEDIPSYAMYPRPAIRVVIEECLWLIRAGRRANLYRNACADVRRLSQQTHNSVR
jgi:hypothetical protein